MSSVVDDLERHVQVLSLRNLFYVTFRNSAVLRWAAKNSAEGKSFETLNTRLWKASGNKDHPEGGTFAHPGANYYFEDPKDAECAAIEFLNALQKKGVKL